VAALGAVRGSADRQTAPQFAATFQAIAKRRGRKIATTAVARKLLTRAWKFRAVMASPQIKTIGTTWARKGWGPQLSRMRRIRDFGLWRLSLGPAWNRESRSQGSF
jgi:hypothetical protein